MLIELLFCMTISIGLTFTLTREHKHPYWATVLALICSTVLCLPALIDVRFLAIPILISILLVIITERKAAIVPLVAASLCCLVMVITPDANNQLYLQTRYGDSFTYLTDGVYRAKRLGVNITVSKEYGDTYQSALYESTIKTVVMTCLPKGSEVRSMEVVPVQTKKMFLSFEDYVTSVNPTVYVHIRLPEWREVNYDNLPYNTILELV